MLTFQTLNLYLGGAINIRAKQTNERIFDSKLIGKFLMRFPSHFSPPFQRFLDYITIIRKDKGKDKKIFKRDGREETWRNNQNDPLGMVVRGI